MADGPASSVSSSSPALSARIWPSPAAWRRGDSLLQQIVGHGVAARISARLGEGVLNGLLTARVGLSALAVCRPMPFAAEKQPGVKDVAPFLFSK